MQRKRRMLKRGRRPRKRKNPDRIVLKMRGVTQLKRASRYTKKRGKKSVRRIGKSIKYFSGGGLLIAGQRGGKRKRKRKIPNGNSVDRMPIFY